ncbi:MAG: hypothetical protein ACLU8W_02435 [Clostridia bacterium]
MDQTVHRKKQADRLLYDCSLLDILKKYGTPHIIGSYRMDLMAWNDLDIDIDITNAGMNRQKLYALTAELLARFQPVWYEAKETCDDEGQLAWFHGFETDLLGERWNIDLWFFEHNTVDNAICFCDQTARQINGDPAKKSAILEIKTYLIEHGKYSFNLYTSMDVYRAVLTEGISTPAEFLSKYEKRPHEADI